MRMLKFLPLLMIAVCFLQALQAGNIHMPGPGCEGLVEYPGQEYPSSQRGWQLTQRTRYRYNDGWQFSYLENYGYNAQGQLDLIARHNIVDGVWNMFGARDYVYNAAGQLLETVYYSIADGVWSGSHRESNVYDTDGNLGQVFVYEGTGNGWSLNYQQANSYEQGRLASEHLYGYYSWDGTFTEFESRFYSYNSDGQLEEKLILTLIVDPHVYTQRMRYIYSYTPDGSLAEILYQFWSGTNGEYVWRDDRRDIYTYDANGWLVQMMRQAPSDSLGWHDTKRYLYTNDDYGNAVHVLYQINFTEGWQDWDKWEKVYANTSNEDEHIPAQEPGLYCSPNPFSLHTQITFENREQASIDLAIYNLKGQKVRTLADGAYPAGVHQLDWDRKDDKGKDLAAGIYFIMLSFGNGEIAVSKATLLSP